MWHQPSAISHQIDISTTSQALVNPTSIHHVIMGPQPPSLGAFMLCTSQYTFDP
jgi:hypothetical protein